MKLEQAWDTEHRARELVGRRDELLRRLPHVQPGTARLGDDVRELIIDDAIQFTALHHDKPVSTAADLERVFWDAAAKRALRAYEHRYDLVRANFKRVDEIELAQLPSNGPDTDPAIAVEEAEERAVASEFAHTLGPLERRVLRCKYDPAERKPLGYKQIAKRLRMRIGTVRATEHAIAERIEHFAAVYCAGRLCPERQLQIASLAAGTADSDTARIALAHVEHCPSCAPFYVQQVRELRSAAFQRKVASLLPALPGADEHRSRLRGAWDAVGDMLTRPFAHDSTTTVVQLAASGAGRGAGTITALKLAALCTASVSAVSVCATTVVIPALSDKPPQQQHTTKASERGRGERPTAPRGPAPHTRLATPTSTPTPTPRKRRRTQGTSPTASQAQADNGPTAHEQAPITPAPDNAAPNGQSQFNPEYQPPAPQPAPASDAPGAREFGP